MIKSAHWTSRFTILTLLLAAFASTSHAVGTLTITNQTTPRLYLIGSKPLLLDPTLRIYYDTTLFPTHTYDASAGPNETIYNKEKAGTWPGGAVYVSIDTVENNNVHDWLTCTPVSPITEAYDTNQHLLTLTAPSSATIEQIQSTLRTLKFYTKGQNTSTRNIRIWVKSANYGFVNSYGSGPNKRRMFTMCSKTRTSASVEPSATSFSWDNVFARVDYEPVFFGLKPYFSSILSQEEHSAINSQLFTQSGWVMPLGGQHKTGTTWEWVAGPEAGTTFPGSPQGLDTGNTTPYAYWLPGEPNNYPGAGNGTETKLEMWFQNGIKAWNDIASTTGRSAFFLKLGGFTSGPYADKNVITVKVVGGNPLILGNPY